MVLLKLIHNHKWEKNNLKRRCIMSKKKKVGWGFGQMGCPNSCYKEILVHGHSLLGNPSTFHYKTKLTCILYGTPTCSTSLSPQNAQKLLLYTLRLTYLNLLFKRQNPFLTFQASYSWAMAAAIYK